MNQKSNQMDDGLNVKYSDVNADLSADQVEHFFALGAEIEEFVPAMYADGYLISSISEKTGVSKSVIANTLWSRGLTDRRVKSGDVYSYLGQEARWHLPKRCQLCGYDRCTDMAHIVPRAAGGTNKPSNILILCKNCHFMYDHTGLTYFEQLHLKEQASIPEPQRLERVGRYQRVA